MEGYGFLLKVCRRRSKINQDELAHRLHTTQSNISKIESGDCEPRISVFMNWLLNTNAQDVLVAMSQNIDLMTIAQTVIDSSTTFIGTVFLKWGGTLQCIINF